MTADTTTPAPMSAEEIEWARGLLRNYHHDELPNGYGDVPHRLLATLDAKDAEIARLTAERDAAIQSRDDFNDGMVVAEARATAAEAERDRLRAALAPFAQAAAWVHPDTVDTAALATGGPAGQLTVADLRRAARAFLEEKG